MKTLANKQHCNLLSDVICIKNYLRMTLNNSKNIRVGKFIIKNIHFNIESIKRNIIHTHFCVTWRFVGKQLLRKSRYICASISSIFIAPASAVHDIYRRTLLRCERMNLIWNKKQTSYSK